MNIIYFGVNISVFSVSEKISMTATGFNICLMEAQNPLKLPAWYSYLPSEIVRVLAKMFPQKSTYQYSWDKDRPVKSE